MEFMAWFTHKYVMHGFLWSLHKDHHRKDHDSWFERNDAFFIFYAIVSFSFFLLWKYNDLWIGLPIGVGIFAYGLAYLWFMIYLFTNVLNYSKKQITVTQKELEEPIKSIINI